MDDNDFDDENEEIYVEFLIAREDNTWTAELKQIPYELFAAGNPGTPEFLSQLLFWANYEAPFLTQDIVYVGVYNLGNLD